MVHACKVITCRHGHTCTLHTHTQILSPFLTQGSLWPSWLLSGLPININEAMLPDSETHVLSGGGDGWQ